MISVKVDEEDTYLGRFGYDSEGMEEIRSFVSDNGIRSGVFSVIGAVKSATIGYYDQEGREYREVTVEGPREIVNCSGNVCLRDGEPFIHAHVCLASDDGNAVGGHLIEMRVFAAELYLRSFRNTIERVWDEESGLSLMGFDY